MQKSYFKIEKTARYFTLGELNKETKIIWFVLHGYAQTADEFLESVKSLQKENTVIVAPEGLSRFYWKDFISNPVASWMTKLERVTDIKDNHTYLQELYKHIINGIDVSSIQINFFGFSQGCATLSRWLVDDTVKADKVVFYAGDIAHDIDISTSKIFSTASLQFIYGNKDRFVSEKKVDVLKKRFIDSNIKISFYTFEGKHEICNNGLNFIYQ